MTPTPYHNNLKKNDRVYDKVSERQGKVAKDPQSTSRKVAITFDGTSTPRYLNILQLRLMTNGHTPEDVPPCDGDPGEPPVPKLMIRRVGEGNPGLLVAAREERARNAEELAAIEKRFKELKATNERLDRAIAILEGL